jgi:hypothetical protein
LEGTYGSIGIGLKKAKDLGIPINPGLRKNHFFYDKLRNACGVERNDGLTWLVPSCINEYEEYKENQKNRDYRYNSNFKNIPLAELVFQKTKQNWKYITATAQADKNLEKVLEPDIFDFLDKRFKSRVGAGISQLDQRRINLGIPSNKGLYYFYTGDIFQKIDDLTEHLKPYALHTAGLTRTFRIPGKLVSEAGDSVYSLTRLFKTYIEQLNAPVAKLVLSKQLETKLHAFCDQVINVAIANNQYRAAGRENISIFTFSFNEIPIDDISNLNSNQILENVDKIRDKMKKQVCGDLEEALNNGITLGIGDLGNKNKPLIKQTTRRKSSENFCYFSRPSEGTDYSNPDLWVQ